MSGWTDNNTKAFKKLQEEEANKKVVRYHPDFTKSLYQKQMHPKQVRVQYYMS